MIVKNWKKEILTIPNLLSLFRLILIPVYVSIYLHADTPGDYTLAAAILAVSCLTDLVDGKIARKFNQITTLGKFLDPLADKATQGAMILCLAVHHPVLWALLVLFVVKEGFQLIAMLLTLRKGMALDGALMAGKISTTILFVTLIIMVLFPGMGTMTANLLTAICFVALVIAFVQYIRAYYGKNKKIFDLDL